jgi:hypothetical protein
MARTESKHADPRMAHHSGAHAHMPPMQAAPPVMMPPAAAPAVAAPDPTLPAAPVAPQGT